MKFLFYLFLFYVVYRYVFGGFKINVYHHNQAKPNPPQPNRENTEEGKITINPKLSKQGKGSSDKVGEYVDFEEVK